MKKLFILLTVVSLIMGIYSCQKTFLQKPDTSGTATLATVYSSQINAVSALLQVYRTALIQGWGAGGMDYGHGVLASMDGEHHRGSSWHGTYQITNSGLSPVGGFDGASGGGSDNFGANYTNIRAANLVAENIDKVPDMDDANKAYVKAEVAELIAYRYMGMFIRYGGVPIVTKSFLPTDNLAVPRSNLQATLDFTLKKADEAIAGLPDKWAANATGGDQTGRLTKGAALATKARVLMYAARPLFNSATPYMSFGANNNMICFGAADPARWTAAIAANEAVLTWASANGVSLINTGGSEGIPNTKAFDDYGNATSTPNNQEIILAYKNDNANQSDGGANSKWYNLSAYQTVNHYDTDDVGLLSNFLPNYYKADGSNQTWPQVGDAAPRPASEYITKFGQMEPRFLADHLGPGINAANNPGLAGWSATFDFARTILNRGAAFPGAAGSGRGDATSTKFFYRAGTRIWFEYPLFRLAETYLNLAEAYNEAGNNAKALSNLNKVHNRAGLPSITETDQTKLRAIIQREWAVEFYFESKRYFDVKHWKLDIGNGIIGGPMKEFQFITQGSGGDRYNTAASLVSYYDAVVYNAYWDNKMFLEPFPQSEINKLIIVQNPGY